MIIEKIDVTHISVPLVKPYQLSKKYGVLEKSEIVVVKMTADDGTVGFGETDPMPLFTEESAETVKTVLRNHLGKAILGENPLNIQAIHGLMDGAIKGNLLAKATIDIACYDLLGKHTDLPVHCLLGGQLRDQVPIMWAIGNDEPTDSAAESIDIKNQGYASIMIKVGSADLRQDLARVQAVREIVGNDFPLIVDANQAWTVDDAIRFSRMIEPYDIFLFEQPVASWDFEGLKKVKQNTRIPISADESLFSIHDASRLISMEAVDVFSIKVVKHGGIFNARAIMDLARANGIPCLMNSMIEEGITLAASLQLGAYAQNLWGHGNAYFSPLRLKDDITDFSLSIRNGTVFVPTGAGLGINVNEEMIEKYSTESFQLSL